MNFITSPLFALVKSSTGIEHQWLAWNPWRINSRPVTAVRRNTTNTASACRVTAGPSIYPRRRSALPTHRRPRPTSSCTSLREWAKDRPRSPRRKIAYHRPSPAFCICLCVARQIPCPDSATAISAKVVFASPMSDSVLLYSRYYSQSVIYLLAMVSSLNYSYMIYLAVVFCKTTGTTIT